LADELDEAVDEQGDDIHGRELHEAERPREHEL
jgi:hypothetical protein